MTTITDGEREIDLRIDAAKNAYRRDPVLALRELHATIQMADAAQYARGAARALRARGMAYGAQGDISKASADFLAALERSRVLGDSQLEAQCLHGLGNAAFHQGEYARALDYLYRSVEIRRRMRDDHGLMAGLNNIGSVHGSLGNFPEAVLALMESLEIARRNQNRQAESLALSNIGLFKLYCNDLAGSLADLEESVRIGEETGDRINLPNGLSNLADVHLRLDHVERARGAAERAVSIATEIGSPYHEIAALRSLARVLERVGDTDGAEAWLVTALKIAVESEVEPKLAGILHDLGAFHLRRGELDQAGEFLQRGLTQARKAEQKTEVADLHRHISALHAERGDFASALESYKQHHEADRALEAQAGQNRLIAQAARMDVENARREMSISRERNKALQASNKRKTEFLVVLQRKTDRLARQATEDTLTGLYNRRYVTDFLEAELARTRAASAMLAVAIADIDDFKQINDGFSHRTGDEVLKATARIFERNVRQGDVVARYGGEEFVVVLPGASRVEAVVLCDRMRAEVAGFDWSLIQRGLRVTISFGVADEPLLSLDEVLALADSRLYHAKRLGKNLVA